MAATTWPANQQGVVLSGDGAKTVGQQLYDRDQCLFASGTAVYFGEQTEVSTSYVTKWTQTILFPPWIKSGHVLTIWIQLRGSAANTGTAQLYEAATPVTGTSAAVVGATYDQKALTLTVPSDSWAGAEKSIEFQLKSTSGVAVGIKSRGIAKGVIYTDG